MWFLLALSCSLFNALQGAYGKRILERTNPYVVTWTMFAYGLPFVGLAALIDGIPPIGPRFWTALAVTLIVNLLAVTLYIRAISLSPLSLTFPFLAFTPLFLVLTSMVAIGERPDAMGLLGIVLIVLGAYALNLDKISQGLLAPIRNIAGERGSLLMLVVAMLWGVSAAADKVALLNSSPIFFVFAFHLLYSLFYYPILKMKAGPQMRQTLGQARVLVFFAFLGAITILSQMTAARMALVSYVVAIKRAGMVFSILLGYLFFGERHLGVRLAAAALMVAGVCCILL